MRRDKEIAFKLRLSGKSYSEINKILGVPKSTMAGWFSGLILSKDLQDKIEIRAHKKSLEGLIKRNKNQTKIAIIRAKSIRKQAADEIDKLSAKDIFMIGIILYWAEGYKKSIVYGGRERTHHPVSLTNSDPDIIKIFLRFLRAYCHVPENKIKAGLRIFQHQNGNELLKYWQQKTKIPQKNFNKTYQGISKASLGKRPFNRLPYGIIQIVVADTALFHKIMGYIEGIKKIL